MISSKKYSNNDGFDIEVCDGKKIPGRFSRTQTFDFIRTYRSAECLWNIGIPEYNDKTMRFLAIKNLSKTFNISVEAVKKKIHALRSTYLQMRDKVNEMENHEPTLSWYYEMDFLDPVITPRKPVQLKKIRNFRRKRPATEELTIEEEDEINSHDLKLESIRHQYEESENTTTNSEQEEVYIEYIENNDRDEDVQEVELSRYYSTDSQERHPPETETSSTPSNPSTGQDEFDVFGQSVAAQLKTMPLVHAIPLMGRIQSLISESRMKSLQHFSHK
ncbi:hypothetical protein DMENIID0001_145450 [Sergentomyia squamirostris]